MDDPDRISCGMTSRPRNACALVVPIYALLEIAVDGIWPARSVGKSRMVMQNLSGGNRRPASTLGPELHGP
ncbi:MAG TPA: hypothetical protein VF516_46655 [Kofleriaceae bacterium]